MREALTAITEELRRLRGLGLRSVPVAESSLVALRAAVAARRAPGEGGAGSGQTSTEERPDEMKPVARGGESREGGVVATAAARPEKKASVEAVRSLPPPPQVVLAAGPKPERWAALREQVLHDATCLAQVRADKKVVFGVGNLDAKVFLCGEAPGAEEEVAGEPFVGPAGQKLTDILGAMGIKREDVYIGNIMNWRPPIAGNGPGEQVGNRPPTDEELRYCLPYLTAQLEIVAPSVIIALGGTAAKGLLGPGAFRSVGEVKGHWHAFQGIPLIVTYHPAYILRQLGDLAQKRAKRGVWEDMLKVMERLEMPISDKQRRYFL